MNGFRLLITGATLLIGAWFSLRSEAAPLALPESHPWVRAVDRDEVEVIARALRSGAAPFAKIQGRTKERLFDRALLRGSEGVYRLFLSRLKGRVQTRKLADARGAPALLSLASLSSPGSPRAIGYERMALETLRFFPDSLYGRDQAYIGDGRLPVHAAAAVGNLVLLRAFLSAGADPNAKNSTGETPLHLAARHGHLEIVRTLLQRGGRPNEKTRFTKATPLMYAAELGRKSVIRELLLSGAKKSSKDVFGKTAKQRYREFSMNSPTDTGMRRRARISSADRI